MLETSIHVIMDGVKEWGEDNQIERAHARLRASATNRKPQAIE